MILFSSFRLVSIVIYSFLLVATSDFPLQCNLPNRYIYPVHHVTDILHPPAYEDGTDKEFRNVGY